MGWDELRTRAVEQLTWFDPDDDEQRRLRRYYLDHLARFSDGHRKVGPAEHLTASCLVFDPNAERIALTLHKKANQWFQFGGHLEETDTDLTAAALREGAEESGLTGLELIGGMLELDRHHLVGDFGRCRTHLDVRFVAVCSDELLTTSAESVEVAWFAVDELPNPALTELVARGVQRVNTR